MKKLIVLTVFVTSLSYAMEGTTFTEQFTTSRTVKEEGIDEEARANLKIQELMMEWGQLTSGSFAGRKKLKKIRAFMGSVLLERAKEQSAVRRTSSRELSRSRSGSQPETPVTPPTYMLPPTAPLITGHSAQ